MDIANLIMYDRGHPTNSLDVYGKYIKLVNAKDGLYPTDPRNLGKEVQIGQGKVDFPSFIRKLKDFGYKGPIIIEREGADKEEWEKEVCQSSEFIQILINSNIQGENAMKVFLRIMLGATWKPNNYYMKYLLPKFLLMNVL